jgi:hypothetical protein
LYKNQKENSLKARKKKSDKRKKERKTKVPSAFKDKSVADCINNNSKIIALSLIEFCNNVEDKKVE